MGIFLRKGVGFPLLNGKADPDSMGSGKGSPQGNKFLTDNQTFTKVTADQIDSGVAAASTRLKANGTGGAKWEAI